MKPTHVRCVRTARVAHARRMHSYTRSCDARSWCSGCARELVLRCAQVLTTGFKYTRKWDTTSTETAAPQCSFYGFTPPSDSEPASEGSSTRSLTRTLTLTLTLTQVISETTETEVVVGLAAMRRATLPMRWPTAPSACTTSRGSASGASSRSTRPPPSLASTSTVTASPRSSRVGATASSRCAATPRASPDPSPDPSPS